MQLTSPRDYSESKGISECMAENTFMIGIQTLGRTSGCPDRILRFLGLIYIRLQCPADEANLLTMIR